MMIHEYANLLLKEEIEDIEKIKNLKANDGLICYHGTHIKNVPDLINGIDANQNVQRIYTNQRWEHKGLFITPDLVTAFRFSSYDSIIFKLLIPAKFLHGTTFSGEIYRKNAEKDAGWLKMASKMYPNSFRPSLSYCLLSDVEPQALFIGYLPPKNIISISYINRSPGAEININDIKWYTKDEFAKIVNSDESQKQQYSNIRISKIDLSNPSINIDDYIEEAARITGKNRDKIIEYMIEWLDDGEDRLYRTIRWGLNNIRIGEVAGKRLTSQFIERYGNNNE